MLEDSVGPQIFLCSIVEIKVVSVLSHPRHRNFPSLADGRALQCRISGGRSASAVSGTISSCSSDSGFVSAARSLRSRTFSGKIMPVDLSEDVRVSDAGVDIVAVADSGDASALSGALKDGDVGKNWNSGPPLIVLL